MPEYPSDYHEFAYVANAAGASVSVLDLVLLKPDHTIAVAENPVAIAANPKRNEVYVVSRRDGQPSGLLTVLDTVRGLAVATIALGRHPEAIAVAPDGTRAFVVNHGSDTVNAVDLGRVRRVTGSQPAGHEPSGVAVSNNGQSVAVTSAVDGSVRLYSAGQVDQPMALRAVFTGCPGATSPVILPDSSKVFAACSAGHQVMAVALAMPPDSWAARQDAGVLKDRFIALLDVGSRPGSLAMKPDGGEIFVSNTGSDTVSEIATTQNEVGSTYPIGNRPGHGIVNADGTRLWVSASGADAVSLYSIEDGKFVSSLPAGGSPDALAFSADQHILLVADARTGDVAVLRTQSKLGPVLLTMLPAGPDPTAIAVKAMTGIR